MGEKVTGIKVTENIHVQIVQNISIIRNFSLKQNS